MKITTINPATEEVLAEYDAIPVEQLKMKYKIQGWFLIQFGKKIDISERSNYWDL